MQPLRELVAVRDQLKSVLATGSGTTAEHLPILTKLQRLVPSDADPRQWLGELIYAIEQYERIHSREGITAADLVRVAKAVNKYRDALADILSFVEERVR